ncbi:hypothetical protein ACFP1C_13050, partial [Levilactobacillus fujinensis]
MKKVKLVALMATTILGVSTFTPLIETVQPAQASTWHKGTPKTIRGKWKLPYQSQKISKSTIHVYSAGKYYIKNVKYKKIGGGVFKVRGYEYTYLDKYNNTYYKLKGHKLMYMYMAVVKCRKMAIRNCRFSYI